VAGAFAFVTGLWLHSGRARRPGQADIGPTDASTAGLPLICLAVLAFACENNTGLVIHARPAHEAQGGVNTDYVRLTGQGSAPAACASPYGCLYYSTTDSLPRLLDASGNAYVAGTAWRARQVAGTPGSMATHDIWADTSTGLLMWRSPSGSVTLGNTGGWVSVDTSQTITGAKTFSAAAVFNGAVTLGDAAADAISVKGALAIDNAANTFAVSLTHAATANRAVTFPDAAGAIVLDSATQTLTNKSISGPQINSGDIAVARIANALTAPGPIGSGTPGTGAFSTLAVAGAPTAATFFRTCTITSAAAATPVACLADADVPAAAAARLGKWHAYVNGGTGWSTTATCTIEDSAGNDLVTIAVAALTANTFVSDHSDNITQEARYRLGTGGAADAGLRVVCDANGTGSDLVFVLMGTVQ